MKILAWGALTGSILLTLRWPFFAMMCNNPLGSLISVVLLSYPWGLVVGLVRIVSAKKKGEVWHSDRTTAFLLMPIVQVAFTYLILTFLPLD